MRTANYANTIASTTRTLPSACFGQPDHFNPEKFKPEAPSNLQGVEKTWNTTIAPLPELEEIREKLDHLDQMTADTNYDVTELADLPTEQWEEKITEYVDKHRRAAVLEDTYFLRSRLVDRASYLKRGNEMFAHVIEQLPVEETIAEFTDAAQQLGAAAYDRDAAMKTNPAAFATVLNEGTKLASLRYLLPLDTGFGNAELFATHKLPRLTFTQVGADPRTGKPDYTQAAKQLHLDAEAALQQAQDVEVFLIALALNAYPKFTFNVATTGDELAKRAAANKKVAHHFNKDNPQHNSHVNARYVYGVS